MDRRRKQLALVGALALGLIVRAFWPWLSNFDSGTGVASFGRAGEQLDAVAPRLTTLRLADLELKPAEYHPGRDPFRFAAKPPPAPPASARPATVPSAQPKPSTEAIRTAAQPPPAPQPPPVDVKYLGSFGPARGKIAVFGDGTDIYNVRKGDILKEHFLVESINYESADLKFVNFPEAPATRLAAGK